MPRTLVAAVAVLVFAALPAIAEAKTYKGKTSQGKTATVRTAANGVVSRARVVWSARCGHNRRFRDSTTFKAPLDAATADMVQDAGTYRVKDASGYVGRITIRLAGQRDPASDRWSGTLAVKVRVSRRGKVVDRCSASKLTWKAK
jgi:hypothetical protein